MKLWLGIKLVLFGALAVFAIVATTRGLMSNEIPIVVGVCFYLLQATATVVIVKRTRKILKRMKEAER